MNSCRFCEIIDGDKKGEEVVYEDKEFIVVTDRFRRTSVGSICLLIPKKHKPNILELADKDGKRLIPTIKMISVAMQVAFDSHGIRIWTAVNKEAGQSIFHCHLRILACRSLRDRFIANFPGIYDFARRISGKRQLSESTNYELAEKIRQQIRIMSN